MDTRLAGDQVSSEQNHSDQVDQSAQNYSDQVNNTRQNQAMGEMGSG